MSGLLTNSPADIVRQMLVDLSLAVPLSTAGSADWAVSADAEPDKPDQTITITDTTGIDAGRTQDGELQEFHGIQLRFRAPTFPVMWSKSQAVKDSLHRVLRRQVTIGSTPNQYTYTVHSVTCSSGPISLGKPEPSRRSVATLNATVTVRQTAGPL